MKVERTPAAWWADLPAEALAWHDRGPKDWIGHAVKIGDDYAAVDRVEDRGDGLWRLHLIPVDPICPTYCELRRFM